MQKQTQTSPIPFFLHNAFLWAFVPILYSFLPVYLSYKGFREGQIGLLMALGPLMSALLQPFIGVYVDRSKSKNTILMILLGGTIASILLLPLDTSFQYIMILSLILASFQSAHISVSETITLEFLETSRWTFGPIRAAGTVGYALVSILLGVLMKQDVRNIFYMTAATGAFCLLTTLAFPKVKGHQSDGNRASIKELFQDKLLILFMLFSMIAQLALSFYQTFFPIYFVSIGGTETDLGILYFLTAMSELPFLFLADKIIRKLGTQITLILSMGVIGIRFILFYFITAPSWVYPVCLLHGLTYIVFAYSLAVYINKTVKKELRATGQTIHGFIGMGMGRILGSILGGFLIEGFGLKNVMLFAFALCITAIVAFITIGSLMKRRNGIVFITPPGKS